MLPFVKRKTYVQADLRFDDLWEPREPPRIDPEASERWAVLSSGGKDSLLSFGLLRELGCEVHSIFVNESGRHWFTALNAYRHFASDEGGNRGACGHGRR